MKTCSFNCAEGTYQAYGYFPFKDFPEDLYNYFCKGQLSAYNDINDDTHFDVVLILRHGYPGITRWNLIPGDSTQGLPLFTLDQLNKLAFIDSLEN